MPQDLLPKNLYTPETDVLNGIAYNPETGKIYLTGKNWPDVFARRGARIRGARTMVRTNHVTPKSLSISHLLKGDSPSTGNRHCVIRSESGHYALRALWLKSLFSG